MNYQVHAAGEITEYLLGSLREDRMEEIEQRILTDEEFHQEVEACEADLLDKYVYGKLDSRARRLFQENFLNSDYRRRKLQFALALKEKLKEPSPRWSFRSYALAASLLVAAGLGAMNLYLTQQLGEAKAQVSALNQKVGAAQLETARLEAAAQGAWSSQDAVLVEELDPLMRGGTRGDAMNEIAVPGGVRRVLFLLKLSAALQGKASVLLKTDTGQVITPASGIAPQTIGGKRFLVATFSTQDLRAGANYFIDVTDENSSSKPDRYALKVVGK